MYKVKLTIDNKSEVIEKEKLLTIGIITKNEPERLERCLKSLIPVRGALDCEIIVTDTGSTDNTVHIAEKYADKVIHFKWCDDFAAARNTGIDEAKGLWFMWIDSDEWIENPEPLIEFFNSGEYKNYASANVSFVNLLDKDRRRKSGITAFRLLILYKDLRFTGKIHEYINRAYPAHYMDILVHHDGYCFENVDEKDNKHKRNIDLLTKVYEEDYENLRTIKFLVEQYRFNGDYENANEYCDKGLKTIENRSIRTAMDKAHKIDFMILQSSNYLEMKKYDKAIWIVEDLKDEDKLLSSRFIDIYAILFISYAKLENFEKKRTYSEKYLDYYLKKDEFDRTYAPVFFHQYDRPDIAMMAISNYIECLSELDNENLIESKIGKYIMKIKKSDDRMDHKISINNYISNIFNLLNKFKDYRFINYVYNQMIESDVVRDIQLLENALLDYILLNKNEEAKILMELSKIDSDRCLIKLSKIVLMNENNEKEKMKTALAGILKEDIDDVRIKSELIYISVKSGLEFSLFRNKMDLFTSNTYIKSLITEKDDYLENVINYYYDMKLVNGDQDFMYFIASMIEGLRPEDLNEKILIEIFNIYSDILPEIIQNIYNENFLNENNIDMYPPIFRFGYFIEKANKNKQDGNLIEYIRELKNCVNHFQPMANVIKQIVKNVEIELAENDNKGLEFKELAAAIKQKIYGLIAIGEYKEAHLITSQLKTILPDDQELNELISRINIFD